MEQSIIQLPTRKSHKVITNLALIRWPKHIRQIYFFQYTFKTFSAMSLTTEIQTYLINKMHKKFPLMMPIQDYMLISLAPLSHKRESIKTQFNNMPIEIIIIQKYKFQLLKHQNARQNRENFKIINKHIIKFLNSLHYTAKNNTCYLPLQRQFQSDKVPIYTIKYGFKWINDNLFLKIKNETKQANQKFFLDEIKAQICCLSQLKMEIQQIHRSINAKYKNREVIAIYGKNITYKISFIDFSMNISKICLQDRDTKISFKQYYKKKYNIDIKDKKQPLIKVAANQYLIPQLVKIVNQQTGSFVDANQMASNNYKFLTTFSSKHPHNILHNLSKFSIQLAERFEAIDAKYLDYPLIYVGKDKTIDSFTKNMFQFSDNKVYQARHCLKIYLIFPFYLQYLNIYEQTIIAAQNIGVEIDLKKYYYYNHKNQEHQILKDIQTLIHRISQVQEKNRIFWLIIEENMSTQYVTFKKMFLNNNIEEISQITLVSTLKSYKRHYQDILMQMAAKMRVTLWKIPDYKAIKMDKRIILIGIYYSHQIAHQTIVTFCCNVNNSMTKIYTEFSLETKQQQILSMKIAYIVQQSIKKYLTRNKLYPTDIIIIRRQNNTRNNKCIQLGEVRAILSVKQKYIYSNIGFNYFAVSKDKSFHTHWIKDIDTIMSCRNGTIIDQLIVDKDSFYVLYETKIKGQISHMYYRSIYKQSSLENIFLIKLMYNQSYNYYNFKGCVYIPGVLKYAYKLSKLLLAMRLNKKLQLQNLRNHLYFL